MPASLSLFSLFLLCVALLVAQAFGLDAAEPSTGGLRERDLDHSLSREERMNAHKRRTLRRHKEQLNTPTGNGPGASEAQAKAPVRPRGEDDKAKIAAAQAAMLHLDAPDEHLPPTKGEDEAPEAFERRHADRARRHRQRKSHPGDVHVDRVNFGLKYRVTHVVTMGIAWSDAATGREGLLGNISIALFGGTVPETVHNFLGLCNHSKGFGFVNSSVHRVVPRFVVQGGDFEEHDGSGGHSFYAEEDEEEFAEVIGDLQQTKKEKDTGDGTSSPSASQSASKSLSATGTQKKKMKNRHFKHENYLVPHGEGTISMASRLRNKTGSQFFILLRHRGHELNRKFVAFGQVIAGYYSTLTDLQGFRVDADHRPVRHVFFSSCSAVPYTLNPPPSKTIPRTVDGRYRVHDVLHDDLLSEEQRSTARAEVDRLHSSDHSNTVKERAEAERSAVDKAALADAAAFEGPLRYFDPVHRGSGDRAERRKQFEALRAQHGGSHRGAHDAMDRRRKENADRLEKYKAKLLERVNAARKEPTATEPEESAQE